MLGKLKTSIRNKIGNLLAEALAKAIHLQKAQWEHSLHPEVETWLKENWQRQKADLLRTLMESQNPRLNPPDSFLLEFERFKGLHEKSSQLLPIRWEERFPCLNDRHTEVGFDRHYVFHTAWAARVLARTRPAKHVDISSLLFFATSISAFIPTEFYDFNPVKLPLDGLVTGKANLLSLPFADSSIESLSCMHVIEHVGLGRYGDPIDADGDLRAVAELRRVLAPNGNLLMVMPMGCARIEFNAHRVYDLESAKTLFAGLEIKEFCLIPDTTEQGTFIESPSAEFVRSQNYACGCFVLTKKA